MSAIAFRSQSISEIICLPDYKELHQILFCSRHRHHLRHSDKQAHKAQSAHCMGAPRYDGNITFPLQTSAPLHRQKSLPPCLSARASARTHPSWSGPMQLFLYKQITSRVKLPPQKDLQESGGANEIIGRLPCRGVCLRC